MHWLQGLLEENSWNLFKKMVFEYGKEPEDSEFVEIGREIVKKCANVPLSIRVIGSLLYGQDKSKWLAFTSVDLSNMGEDKKGISPVLKFSYYHLTPSLKSCFSYCALFPKDYVIEKQFLINLWMAQGCLDDGVQDGRSIEDVGDDFFSILLQRCFLQDVIKNGYDEVHSCKMHDLIHDLAQEVAGKEFFFNTVPNDGKIHHLSVDDRNLIVFAQKESLDKMKDLRTIFMTQVKCLRSNLKLDVNQIFLHVRHLRVCRLHGHFMYVIPKTLGSLIHLRYLEITGGIVKTIPNSITKLLNLRVLKLSSYVLEELPKDLGKLVNLRQLDIMGCHILTHMPAGLDNLTCLRTLTAFVLGRGSSNQVEMGQLQDLKHLLQLRDELTVVVSAGYSYDATNAEGGYLLNKSHIKALAIKSREGLNFKPITIDEGLLEVLEPHCNVRSIEISGYKDMNLPNWAGTLGSSLPLLVHLWLESFPRLQHLPPLLSQLQHLKFLTLRYMDSVEYMVDDNNDIPLTQGSRRTKELTFFPSLKRLELTTLSKLKGWWRDDVLRSMECSGQDGIPSFPRLQKLIVSCCPNMTNIPGCPHSHLKNVQLCRVDGLKTEAASGRQQTCVGESSSTSSKPVLSSNSSGFDLDELLIDNVGMLNSLFGESLRVKTLQLAHSKIKRLSEAIIDPLWNLQHLKIWNCKELEIKEEGDGMIPWIALSSLTRLSLCSLPKMVSLPKGLQHLSSLQSLHIQHCDNLEALPEWLDTLTSLQFLHLEICRGIKSLPEAIGRLPSLTRLELRYLNDMLRRRCTEPDGEDCPKIRHIPTIIWRDGQASTQSGYQVP